MTTTYTASRDSDNSRTDEDRAMAHELIYHHGVSNHLRSR